MKKEEKKKAKATKSRKLNSRYIYMIATTLGIVVVAALCIFVYNQQSGLVQIDFNEYLKLNESEARKLIYVGDNGIVSQELTPVLKELLVKNHKQAYFFEHKKLSSEEQLKFVKSNSVTKKEDGYILPFLIVVENKKVVASYEGYLDKESLETFLKKNDYIK